MASFSNLPTELRHEILDYVVTASAYLYPPDVEALQPEEWICQKPTHPPACRPGIIRHFRRVRNAGRLVPLMLVSKAFAKDTSYVWSLMAEPKLVPTLNIDCVGHGISSYRPLVGTFLKWLYLPTTFKTAKQIEIRIRHFDHHVWPEGSFLRRAYP
jgi:hypothetical protein